MARSPEFHTCLDGLGIAKDEAGELSSLLTEISRAIDQQALELGQSSDIGGMAKSALIESLALQMRDKLPSLFEPTAREVRHALAGFSSGSGFATLSRDFFARLTYRSLDCYLSRELANHTGAGARFADDAGRVAFLRPNVLHLLAQIRIALGAARGTVRITPDGAAFAESRRDNLQNSADRLDTMVASVIFDEGNHLRNGRSSFACAKSQMPFWEFHSPDAATGSRVPVL